MSASRNERKAVSAAVGDQEPKKVINLMGGEFLSVKKPETKGRSIASSDKPKVRMELGLSSSIESRSGQKAESPQAPCGKRGGCSGCAEVCPVRKVVDTFSRKAETGPSTDLGKEPKTEGAGFLTVSEGLTVTTLKESGKKKLDIPLFPAAAKPIPAEAVNASMNESLTKKGTPDPAIPHGRVETPTAPLAANTAGENKFTPVEPAAKAAYLTFADDMDNRRKRASETATLHRQNASAQLKSKGFNADSSPAASKNSEPLPPAELVVVAAKINTRDADIQKNESMRASPTSSAEPEEQSGGSLVEVPITPVTHAKDVVTSTSNQPQSIKSLIARRITKPQPEKTVKNIQSYQSNNSKMNTEETTDSRDGKIIDFIAKVKERTLSIQAVSAPEYSAAEKGSTSIVIDVPAEKPAEVLSSGASTEPTYRPAAKGASPAAVSNIVVQEFRSIDKKPQTTPKVNSQDLINGALVLNVDPALNPELAKSIKIKLTSKPTISFNPEAIKMGLNEIFFKTPEESTSAVSQKSETASTTPDKPRFRTISSGQVKDSSLVYEPAKSTNESSPVSKSETKKLKVDIETLLNEVRLISVGVSETKSENRGAKAEKSKTKRSEILAQPIIIAETVTLLKSVMTKKEPALKIPASKDPAPHIHTITDKMGEVRIQTHKKLILVNSNFNEKPNSATDEDMDKDRKSEPIKIIVKEEVLKLVSNILASEPNAHGGELKSAVTPETMSESEDPKVLVFINHQGQAIYLTEKQHEKVMQILEEAGTETQTKVLKKLFIKDYQKIHQTFSVQQYQNCSCKYCAQNSSIHDLIRDLYESSGFNRILRKLITGNMDYPDKIAA